MPQTESQDEARVAGYVGATEKYGLAPVPTPLSREAAVNYIRDNLTTESSVKLVRRLMRLAVFYNLQDSASAFADLLNKVERAPDDFRRSALCLVAIAWIGNKAEVEQAREYYHRLLRRAKAVNSYAEMEQVCDAFGPVEGTKELQAWVEREADKVRETVAQHEKDGNRSEAELAGNRLATLEQYLSGSIPALKQALHTRAEIDAMTNPALQIPKLTELYVDVLRKSTEQLSFWAAMRLQRLAEKDPSTTSGIIARFEQMAKANDKRVSEDMQHVYDLNRARCLRAAVFFGHTLDKQPGDWLAAQKDVGADPLALRPDWDYAGH